jgi:uncharacterized protein
MEQEAAVGDDRQGEERSDDSSTATGVAPAERFPDEVITALKSYVYLLVDPRNGRPIAVGRGKGNRCFRRLAAFRAGEAGTSTVLSDRVRAIEAQGRPVRIDILRHGLTGEEAKAAEQIALDALGLVDGPGPSGPGRRAPVAVVRSALARPAKFKQAHQVVLLRLPATELPAIARHQWRIGRRWTDLDSPRAPKWAVVVVDDVVQAVCSIDGWEATGSPASPSTRYILMGRTDPELERRYLGRSVAHYRSAGSRNPVTYIWCGPHWVNR